MPSFTEKVAAIVGALGMPPDMAAIPALSAACQRLGITPDPTTCTEGDACAGCRAL